MAGGARRFEFGWLEVFGLILAFAGGSVVVFFLGVFVGKGLQESRIAREERVFRLAIDPVEDNAAPAASGAAGGAPAPHATAALALAVRPAPAATVPAPVASASMAPMAVPAPSPTSTETRLAAVPSPIPSVTAALIGAGRGSWSVQVNATKDRYTARQIVEQLRGRGYNAYTVEVPVRGETWYRVRVGRFPTMGAATATVVRLKSEERFTRAFLVEE